MGVLHSHRQERPILSRWSVALPQRGQPGISDKSAAWPRPACALSVIARHGISSPSSPTHILKGRLAIENLAWLLTSGFAKGHRMQVLGMTTALSAVALWAVGDMSLADLLGKLPIALGGLGLATLGAKVDDAKKAAGAKPAKAK
jgi:hypothetical protein